MKWIWFTRDALACEKTALARSNNAPQAKTTAYLEKIRKKPFIHRLSRRFKTNVLHLSCWHVSFVVVLSSTPLLVLSRSCVQIERMGVALGRRLTKDVDRLGLSSNAIGERESLIRLFSFVLLYHCTPTLNTSANRQRERVVILTSSTISSSPN